MTTLKVEYPDYYIVMLEDDNGVKGCLNFNIASRKVVRNMELYGQDFYLEWKGAPESL